MRTLWPTVARIIATTPQIELRHNKSMTLMFSIEKNEDNLWQIDLKSLTRHISKKAPSVFKEIKARLMIINAPETNTKNYLSIVFITPDGHVIYPILNLDDIDINHGALTVYIILNRTSLNIQCVKDNYLSELPFRFACPLYEAQFTLRQILEDIRLN